MIGMISPYGVFYRNAERAGIVGLLFLGIIGVLAAALVVVLTRGITSSASDLRRGTEEFAKGNLAFRIKPSGKDELAELAKAYNAMAESISVHQDALRQRADEIESLYAVSVQLSPHLSEEELAAIILKILSPPEGGKKSLLLLRNRFTGKWYRAAAQGFHGFDGFSPEPGGAPDAHRTPPELPSLQKAALFSPEEMPGLHAMLGNEPGAHLLAVPLLIDDAMEGLCLIGGLGAAEGTDEERMTFYNNLALQAEGALEKTRMMQDTVTSEKLAALNRTSSLLAHDLKNLITRLTAIAQNVKTMIDDPAFRSRLSFYLEDTIKKFDSTIIRLVTVGSGDRRSLESVDLNEIIGEALRSLNVAQEPGIEVQKEFTTVTPVPLYRSDFRRIVENLLRNAVDAMPNGGKLLIATEMAGNDRVRIIVQDTGCGMSKEFLEKKLFQPFATTKRKGMGLGLYAAWETIKECGGTLDVQSQTGVGTTITITLPVRPR